MRIAFLVLAVFTLSPSAEAVDWLTLPSRYTHNPSTGERISQYRKIQAPSVPQPANFRTSGYTHTRSSLNYGQSADNYHRVEQWETPCVPTAGGVSRSVPTALRTPTGTTLRWFEHWWWILCRLGRCPMDRIGVLV